MLIIDLNHSAGVLSSLLLHCNTTLFSTGVNFSEYEYDLFSFGSLVGLPIFFCLVVEFFFIGIIN